MRILTLTLKKKWFNLIKSGEKKIEYRDYTEYWCKRLLSLHDYTHIQFRNGYRRDAPAFIIELLFTKIINEKTELKEGSQFALHLGKIVGNCPGCPDNSPIAIRVMWHCPSCSKGLSYKERR